MNAKYFLGWGGLVILILGILGLAHVLGPTAALSIFGASWFFTTIESWILIAVGVISAIAGFGYREATWQGWLSLYIGIIGIIAGIVGFFIYRYVAGATWGTIGDNLINLAVGLVAVVTSFDMQEETGKMCVGKCEPKAASPGA